jgi:hypothetical protein
VSYGLDLHECDLLAITASGYATEVEIKVSVSDLRADARKEHGHRSIKIKFLYFAMPIRMKGHEDLVPERAGILYIDENGFVRIERRAKPNKGASKFTGEDVLRLARLGVLRMWNFKLRDLNRSNSEQYGGDYSI